MKKLLPLLALIIICALVFLSFGDKEIALQEENEFLKGFIVTQPDDGTKYGIITIPFKENLRMVFYQDKSSEEIPTGTYVQCQLYKKGNFVEAKNLKKYKPGDKVLNDLNNLPPRSKTNTNTLIRELSINAHYHEGDRYSGSGKHDIWHPQNLSSSVTRTIDGILYKGITIIEKQAHTTIDPKKLDAYVKAEINLNTSTPYYILSSSKIPNGDSIIVTLTTEHPPHHLILE